MTQEDKLLLQDLCARLPYGVNCEGFYSEEPDYKTPYEHIETCKGHVDGIDHIGFDDEEIYIIIEGIPCELFNVKLYLRPISSMTDEEVDKLFRILKINEENAKEWLKVNDIGIIRLFTEEGKDFYEIAEAIDYLNSIHIDYRGLIEKGLAIEVTEDNNPYKPYKD